MLSRVNGNRFALVINEGGSRFKNNDFMVGMRRGCKVQYIHVGENLVQYRLTMGWTLDHPIEWIVPQTSVTELVKVTKEDDPCMRVFSKSIIYACDNVIGGNKIACVRWMINNSNRNM